MLAVPSNLRCINFQRFFYTLSTSANILFISIFIKRLLKEQVRSGALLQTVDLHHCFQDQCFIGGAQQLHRWIIAQAKKFQCSTLSVDIRGYA